VSAICIRDGSSRIVGRIQTGNWGKQFAYVGGSRWIFPCYREAHIVTTSSSPTSISSILASASASATLRCPRWNRCCWMGPRRRCGGSVGRRDNSEPLADYRPPWLAGCKPRIMRSVDILFGLRGASSPGNETAVLHSSQAGLADQGEADGQPAETAHCIATCVSNSYVPRPTRKTALLFDVNVRGAENHAAEGRAGSEPC
jgi:hypothetical protein